MSDVERFRWQAAYPGRRPLLSLAMTIRRLDHVSVESTLRGPAGIIMALAEELS